MSKVVLGFSGGVDSAVSAVLLQRAGHEVHGVYLDNAEESARLDAVSAAERMGISLTVIDVKRELEENVCRPFTEAYLRGETPNPCIICNPSVKFKTLIAVADRIDAELVATGHSSSALFWTKHADSGQGTLPRGITPKRKTAPFTAGSRKMTRAICSAA